MEWIKASKPPKKNGTYFVRTNYSRMMALPYHEGASWYPHDFKIGDERVFEWLDESPQLPVFPEWISEQEIKNGCKELYPADKHYYQMFAVDPAEVWIKAIQWFKSKTPKSMKSGIELIGEERKRHFDVEKWDEKHDAKHGHAELIGAAACYAMEAANKDLTEPRFRAQIHRQGELDCMVNSGDRGDRQLKKAGWEDAWPWSPEWDKRKKHDKLKCLVIAGALIAAEIDRLHKLQ